MKQILAYTISAMLICVLGACDNKEDENNYEKALEAYEEGNLKDAWTYLRQETEENPENGMAWSFLIDVYNDLEQYEAALQTGKKALNTLGEDDKDALPYVYESMTKSYMRTGDYGAALEHIDSALVLKPGNKYFLVYKADCQYYSGDSDGAIETISMAIDSASADDKSILAGLYYRRGFYRDNSKDIDGAMKDYSKCLRLNPRHAYAHLGRGDMHMLRNEVELAREDYQNVVELDTAIRESGNCRHYGYQGLGMNDCAERHMNKILAKYPTYGNYYDAACLMSRIGNRERALHYLKKSLEAGYVEFCHIDNDDDMDAIRDTQEYRELMARYRQKQKSIH